MSIHYVCFILPMTLLIVGFSCCNTTRIVKPLEQGEVQIGADFGGPMIYFSGLPITIPLTSVHAAYGYKTNTTLFTSIHTTALMFGVIQNEFGLTHQLMKQKRYIPGISVSPILNTFIDTWEANFRIYPQLDLNLYWNYQSKPHLFFISANNWFELSKQKAHGEVQQNQWLPSLGIGHQWNTKRFSIQLESKWLAPTQSNQDIVVDYVATGNKGAIGIYFGISKKF